MAKALGKGMNLLIPSAMGWLVSQQFCYKACFGIKLPTKIDRPLNKEHKTIRCSFGEEGLTPPLTGGTHSAYQVWLENSVFKV